MPSNRPDMRPFPVIARADIAEIKEQLQFVTGQLARHKQIIARLLERQDKIERMFMQLSQIQGTMALAQLDDDLEMEPGVAVWTPVEVDD